MEELKPCKCGGLAELWTSPYGDYVKCCKCGMAITFFDFDHNRVISIWNVCMDEIKNGIE